MRKPAKKKKFSSSEIIVLLLTCSVECNSMYGSCMSRIYSSALNAYVSVKAILHFALNISL